MMLESRLPTTISMACEGFSFQKFKIPNIRLPSSKSICTTNASASCSFPRHVCAVPHQEVEPRGSVWGRLGKPCDELSVSSKTELHDAGIREQKVLD
ncbi:Uncharacterized protein TCM_036754 [Theobroma cacao]|uniref:Uncharacterized protein n=1 Tax=Theobroma cacao TaxID=3641 RepID=A0A061GIY2_THECC|nr:Uncharacterized protein TCM_036754 [Theobroma cacao]